MHVSSIEIRNVRAFTKLRWNLQPRQLRGWHVVIGDNGSGKSTFLRALALVLTGPKDAQALREDWSTWCRKGKGSSSIHITVQGDSKWDRWAGRGKQTGDPSGGIVFSKASDGEVRLNQPQTGGATSRHIWSRRPGWFSAGFGPFRRFTGGDPEQRKLFFSHPSLARHLTVFGENVALTEAIEWLKQLRFEELDGSEASGRLLGRITRFVNQPDFLPHDVRLESVSAKAVNFRNPEGFELDVSRLSDGFRSILSLTFELIRQMVLCYGIPDIFKEAKSGPIVVTAPGVVLIDEVDAHLHPTWQRRIGQWLTGHFPNIQFIVTTHSPLVCQAAENGSIFRLPVPGGGQGEADFVRGTDYERLVFGDVLDAYGTTLFGQAVDRSNSGKERMKHLAELNQKALRGKLTPKETAERRNLQKLFGPMLKK